MKRQYLFIMLCLFLWTTSSYADGMFVSNIQRHLEEPVQKAVITWDGQKETMIISAAVKSSDIANFAWIIPISSRTTPIVSKADIRVFTKLVKYFEKDRPSHFIGKELFSRAGVEVVESKEIDIYDITILKATNAQDLLEWLTENEYMTPLGAGPILEKYINSREGKKLIFDGLPPPSNYFVANKIDLKNKHLNEIHDVRRIFLTHKKKYDHLCSKVNQFFASYGLQEKVGSKPYSSHQHDEVLGIIHNAVHDPENPFKLHRKWSAELGQGIKVEEICSAEPYFKDKRINFRRPEGRRWAMAVYRNGHFVDVLDYRGYTKQQGTSGRHVSPERIKFTSLPQFNLQERLLLQKYLHKRKEYHQVYKARIKCDKKLEAVIRELSASLGDTLWELKQLSRDLFHTGVTMWNQPEVFPADNIPIHVQTLAVSERLGTQKQKKGIAPLYHTIRTLQKGMATPLKFDFHPLEPTYPLLISSLNKGLSLIEVYVVSDKPVVDRVGTLKVSQSKSLSSQLKKDLTAHMDIGKSRYVTRLYYQGMLNNLKADAVFSPDSNAQTRVTQIGGTKQEGSTELKMRIAADQETPSAILAKLADDANRAVRFAVADNPSASPETLQQLSSDTFRGVRHNVAKNGNSPPDVLVRLARDPNKEVRWEVAMNPNSPAEALKVLAASDEAKMRLTVVEHPKAPIEVLENLIQDEDPQVADTAYIALEKRKGSLHQDSSNTP